MLASGKYGRTYHYPFSPGTTNDDRINEYYWQHLSIIPRLIHTEKLDGENNCLNRNGVFARSHAAPTQSLWTYQLRQRWELIKNDLGNIELFGENLFAIHSIEYHQLEDYFFIFAVRCLDTWLGWEEVQFYAELFDFSVVPILQTLPNSSLSYTPAEYNHEIILAAGQTSHLASWDVQTRQPCNMEGIVTRNAQEFTVEQFAQNVFKYVRKNHVKTDQHWRRNWQRAKLAYERQCEK